MCAKSYSERREQIRQHLDSQRKQEQESPPIPPVANRRRRNACIKSFEKFCRTYGAVEFNLPWSQCHIDSAATMQRSVDKGGWFAWAMPRGSGKTTLCEWLILWAVLTGRTKYAVIVGANDRLAEQRLESIKVTLEFNQLLKADFPHVCVPVAALEGEARKAKGQRYNGEKTKAEWGSDRVVMPWVDHKDSISSGAVVECYGLTGAIRGLKRKNKDGTSERPSLIVADDPQTRESAKSVTQTQDRLQTLAGDIGYLCGPNHSISVVCPCTVIYRDDLADQILNRDIHPEWGGLRYKMVEEFPENMELWDQYADMRRSAQKLGGDGASATDFYRQNRDAMDKGHRVSWPDRYWEDEISGLQHAMNVLYRDEASFYSEYQNEPVVDTGDLKLLTPDEICAKQLGYARGVVPPDCSLITAFADVQKEHLFWLIMGWAPDFTGYVLDYGAWPDQKRNYFTRRDLRRRMSDIYPGEESGMMYGALNDLGKFLADRTYKTTEGRELKLSRWCIDGNWRARTAAVVGFARQSKWANLITITQGRGVKATEVPFSEAQRAKKWRTAEYGYFWQDGPGPARWATFDANLWKKRVHEALALSSGSRGGLHLFKAPPHVHRMLADHLRSEKPEKVEARGRTVYEFQDPVGRDNEGLDCIVGNYVAASICGLIRDSERPVMVKKRKRRMEVLG